MNDNTPASQSRIDFFPAPDGNIRVQVRFVDETAWLTQKLMADLFQVSVPTINEHLRNIFADRELVEEAVIRNFRITASDGKEYLTKHYSLDSIIAVGYRVRSSVGVQFRRWATQRLREFMVKGFTMDDERLMNPGGWDHFDELLERIRAIRASEKRFYQKIKDLFAQTSADYDGSSETAHNFFKTIQNKMLYAITGKTAAQIVVERANAAAPNMGLTSFKGAVARKGDVLTSKNYLQQDELSRLDRLVTMFLDHAEDRAEKRQRITMQEWVGIADRFLEFNEWQVLTNAGTVSRLQAEEHAHGEYRTFDNARRQRELEQAEIEAERDFEELVKGVEGRKP
ncbi:hydroxyacid dehydrogenase [Pseudodesulfovibrio sp. F-1]|uniref:Hydroxyacid dehydrogenase n=1 Tax=Pseudodesulfovibrio alkaliphilus TaxID=2661613 RepID=A0A7K1KMN5_9BACT|nr:virulence RhuM family protein [Pseudodesulfovibrio alkaliphilus]MUM77348.1 hydroxyacid dehydrogenase [Pseudodesulfovibrio alkaliphilus]